MKRILIAALLLSVACPALAQKTKATLNTEIGVQFPDNTTGTITPSNLRTVTADIVNSILPTAPVVSGNLACFNGTTGLLQDCGLAPSSIHLTIGSTVIAGGVNTRVLYDNNGILGELGSSGSGSVALTTSPVFTTPTLGVASATSLNSLSITGQNSQANIGIGTSLSSASLTGNNVVVSNANALTSGDQNVCVGTGGTCGSLREDTGNTLGGYDVAPLLHNAIIPQNFNSAWGNQALRSCTTCGSNAVLGRAGMLAATIDDHDTCVGHACLFTGVGNSQVTAIGDSAGGTALVGTAIPSGFPNVGTPVFPFNGDTNVECIGESCGKTSSSARKQSFAMGTYSRIPAQDNSFWLGNGMAVGGTAGVFWSGGGPTPVTSSTGVTLTAAQVLSGGVFRTGAPGGGFTDTLPTAQQIIQSTSGGPGNGCEVGAFRYFTYSNVATGQTATIQANGATNPGGGVTLASVSGAFTVANNTGTLWAMKITNCTLSSEAITLTRVM